MSTPDVKPPCGAAWAEKDLVRRPNEKLSEFKALRQLEFVDDISKTVTGKPRGGLPEG